MDAEPPIGRIRIASGQSDIKDWSHVCLKNNNDLLIKMKLDDIVKGKISKITDIAVYVDIVDSERQAICLLSQLSRKRLRTIPSYVQVGNVLDFQIIRIDDGYIDLSRKYL